MIPSPWGRAQDQLIKLGGSWVRVSEIAAVAREGQDESRVHLSGSNASVRVPLPPDEVIERLRRMILQLTLEEETG